MRHGELSVTRPGQCLMPRWCAGNWSTQDKVSCTDGQVQANYNKHTLSTTTVGFLV